MAGSSVFKCKSYSAIYRGNLWFVYVVTLSSLFIVEACNVSCAPPQSCNCSLPSPHPDFESYYDASGNRNNLILNGLLPLWNLNQSTFPLPVECWFGEETFDRNVALNMRVKLLIFGKLRWVGAPTNTYLFTRIPELGSLW